MILVIECKAARHPPNWKTINKEQIKSKGYNIICEKSWGIIIKARIIKTREIIIIVRTKPIIRILIISYESSIRNFSLKTTNE